MNYNLCYVTLYCWDNELEKPTHHRVLIETFAEDWEGISPTEWRYIEILVTDRLGHDEEICDGIDPKIEFVRSASPTPF